MIGNILCVAGFNVAGVMVTKYASAAQRSTIDSCRTLTIWIIMISVGKEKFIMGELLGFVLLVLGTLIYNEIIEIPIEFFNRYTKRNIAAREAAQNQEKKLEKPSFEENTLFST